MKTDDLSAVLERLTVGRAMPSYIDSKQFTDDLTQAIKAVRLSLAAADARRRPA